MWRVHFKLYHITICTRKRSKATAITAATTLHFHHVLTAKNPIIHKKRCWWRPDIKCHKCGKLGHVERICKSQQQQGEAKTTVEQPQEEEQLFVASCFATSSSTESWLIDSGCTSHMTYDQELFKELDKTAISKVRIGNGAYLAVKGKGTVAIEGHRGLKLISNVLYVPEINQNLLSVGQLPEKGYKVLFEGNHCLITDTQGIEVFKV